jgi:menaquinone-dependent protoporphyrinogen oxidase
MVTTPRVLVVFHTSEGQTARIADRIASVLRERGLSVEVREIESAPAPDGYDGVVVGDSIHAVKHSRAMVRYLESHVASLNAIASAVFQVSLTSANPDAEHRATAHALLQELLDRTGFDPDIVGLFAGALVYTQYGWLKRHVMRAIVKREGGDLDMTRDFEYTDWAAVERFAKDVDILVRSTAES